MYLPLFSSMPTAGFLRVDSISGHKFCHDRGLNVISRETLHCGHSTALSMKAFALFSSLTAELEAGEHIRH